MIDIHTHILTNIDNGCIDYNDAGKIILQAKAQGVTDIVLTPHEGIFSKFTAEELIAKFKSFAKIFDKYGVELYLGAEIDYSKDALVKVFYKSLLPINNTNIALIDFSKSKEDYHMLSAIQEYKKHNIRIIIAHTEIYDMSIKEIDRLKIAGAYIDVSAKAILDKKYDKWIKEMLKERLIDFVSSNIHSSKEEYLLKDAYQKVLKLTNKDYADLVFNRNAKNLLLKKGNAYFKR